MAIARESHFAPGSAPRASPGNVAPLAVQTRPWRVFISYAHKDEQFRRELEKHLSLLRQQNILEVWSDRSIEAGQEWEQSISEKLEVADIIVLLISPDFVNSKYIYEKELKRAMERHETGEARVIPVFLRPFEWKDATFSKLQGVPDKPITLWKNRDEAFTIVTTAIRRAADSLRSPASALKRTSLLSGASTQRMMRLAAGAGLTVAAVAMLVWGLAEVTPKPHQQSVTVEGPANSPIVQVQNTQLRDLIIQPGDPPEVRREKLLRAQKLLAGEMMANLEAMSNRIELVRHALEPDHFAQDLDEVRRRVAPALVQIGAEGYQRLINAQQAASLRHALNSERLRSDVPGPLLQVLVDAGSSLRPVQTFYVALAEVERVTESLLANLDEIGRSGTLSAEDQAYGQMRLDFDVALLRNRTQTAHLAGLYLLGNLDPAAQSEVADQLAMLSTLEPRQPLDEAAYTERLAPVIAESQRLLAQRAELLTEAQRRRDAKLEELRRVDETLQIAATDSWSVVVGKARALRELGRIGDAVRAFARYGEMFAAQDPTAEQYARTAQMFTQQLRDLGVTGGGVYLFEIRATSTAAQAGLQVGDILISYAGQPVPGPTEIIEAMHSVSTDDIVRLEYLRLMPEGQFSRRMVNVPSGPLGIGMMPI